MRTFVMVWLAVAAEHFGFGQLPGGIMIPLVICASATAIAQDIKELLR